MANKNYSTAFQIGTIEKRLKILSSVSIKDLSKDQLMSNLNAIHENHNQLVALIDEDRLNLAFLAKRLYILSAAINEKGLSKGQLLSTHGSIQENHNQLSRLLNEGRNQPKKTKLEVVL